MTPRKLATAAYLAAGESDVDDEGVFLGVVWGYAAPESVAVDFGYVAHEPAQKVNRVARSPE